MRFGAWLVTYLVGMAALSFLGGRNFGGLNVLAKGWDIAAVIIVSLAIYGWGIRQGIACAACEPTGAVDDAFPRGRA